MANYKLTPLTTTPGAAIVQFNIKEGGFSGGGSATTSAQVGISPAIPGLNAGNLQDGLTELVAMQGVKIAFSFGDASPVTVLTAQAGQRIKTVTIVVTTPFNGVSPQLSVGDAGNPNRLFPSSAIDPKDTAAEWEYNPNHQYAASTPILLTITPDGSTQGSGFIYIERS